MNTPYNSNTSFLQFPRSQNPNSHHAELAKLTRSSRYAWIQLESTLIRTRYHLNVVEFNFKESVAVNAIQYQLQKVLSVTTGDEDYFNEFYLVAESHTDSLFYNISDYVQHCVAGDVSVAERLRGRTVLYIHSTEYKADDLLTEAGTENYIRRILMDYIETYGTEAVTGFAVELPKFLSILSSDGSSIPWSNSILKKIDTEDITDERRNTENLRGSLLPSLFYETYNTGVIRGIYWQELTSQFAAYFLEGVRLFCNQYGLRFAVSIPESARSLQFDLGTLLQKIDCPILISGDSDSPRRFVVGKSVCSNEKNVGISRLHPPTFLQSSSDATYGLNQWITHQKAPIQSNASHPTQYLEELLQFGSPMRSILMLSPIQSLWMKPDEKQWNVITKAWGWLCEVLWNMGHDYDIVSEQQLMDCSAGGKKPEILLNDNRYSLVFIPNCISLHATTVERLTAFSITKGRIIINAPAPYLLNGRIGLAPYQLEHLIFRRNTYILDGPNKEREEFLKKNLRKWVISDISVYHKQSDELATVIKIHRRYEENRKIFYLFNSGITPVQTLVEILGEYTKIEEANLRTGENHSVDSWHANGRTYIDCQFKPAGAKVYLVS